MAGESKAKVIPLRANSGRTTSARRAAQRADSARRHPSLLTDPDGRASAEDIAAVVREIAGAGAREAAVLAARWPQSGGAYVYGREALGPVWGYLAGVAFVVGKLASCAAMALAVLLMLHLRRRYGSGNGGDGGGDSGYSHHGNDDGGCDGGGDGGGGD